MLSSCGLVRMLMCSLTWILMQEGHSGSRHPLQLQKFVIGCSLWNAQRIRPHSPSLSRTTLARIQLITVACPS